MINIKGMKNRSTDRTVIDKATRRLRLWCAQMLPWHQRLKQQSNELINKYQVQDWFRNIPIERPYVYDIIKWLVAHVRRDGLIVELGCGIGQNFIELSRFGYYRFLGADNDSKALACARELLKRYNIDAELRSQEGHQPLHLNSSAAVCLPLNWTYLIQDLSPIFSNAREDLESGGFFIIDIIDKHYEGHYHPDDSHLPFAKRRATAYPYRRTADEVEEIGARYGFGLIKSVHSYFPRFVMYFQKE
jgi:SAM-dependent methyltransferase